MPKWKVTFVTSIISAVLLFSLMIVNIVELNADVRTSLNKGSYAGLAGAVSMFLILFVPGFVCYQKTKNIHKAANLCGWIILSIMAVFGILALYGKLTGMV